MRLPFKESRVLSLLTDSSVRLDLSNTRQFTQGVGRLVINFFNPKPLPLAKALREFRLPFLGRLEIDNLQVETSPLGEAGFVAFVGRSDQPLPFGAEPAKR